MDITSWLTSRSPLTTKQLLDNTEFKRVKRAESQIKVTSYSQEFILKKVSLFQKVKSFFTREKVFTLFVRFKINTENKKNGNKHLVYLVVPYLKDMNTRTLSDIPIQVYSSTADFKFRMAYNLNKLGNVYLNDYTTKKLGIALTTKPTVVVRPDMKMFDKHLYYVISNIDKLKVTI